MGHLFLSVTLFFVILTPIVNRTKGSICRFLGLPSNTHLTNVKKAGISLCVSSLGFTFTGPTLLSLNYDGFLKLGCAGRFGSIGINSTVCSRGIARGSCLTKNIGCISCNEFVRASIGSRILKRFATGSVTIGLVCKHHLSPS